VATDSTQTSTQLAQGLYDLRKSIVLTANANCNADGTSTTSGASTPGLWSVCCTDPSPSRFIATTTTSGTTGGTGTSSGGDGGDHHGGTSGGSGSTTTTTTTTTLPGGLTATCDPSNASCYVNLDLTAPELLGMSATLGSIPHLPTVVLPANPSAPFVGGAGNSLDPAIYQTQTSLPNTLPNEVKTLSALVDMNKGQANYFAPTPANLSPTYGSQSNPAVVVITDPTTLNPSLVLQQPLTGFGILVVPNDFEIAAGVAFNWTGVVLVRGGAAKFVVGAGATGFINGSLMLQPTSGTAGTVQTSTGTNSGTSPIGFRISYSCDAIDLAFNALPFKVISSSESSF